ncbi:MAG: hypothetical protein IT180_07850 [Acidobacteria bacterium]|nr:hypothetical protein [Acidobacteriota bacterium]
MAEGTVPILLRPLHVTSLETDLPVNISHEVGDLALHLLSELTQNWQTPLDTLRARYREVTNEDREPVIVPDHDVITRHIIRPLREAKQCYVLGMPVACIAQAGLVGEMVALWRFRMLSPQIDGRPLDEEVQRALLGREFDRLRQEERVRVLRALDNLGEDVLSAFGELRALRRRYLHFMVATEANVDDDARRALEYAGLLVIKTLNISLANGAIVLPERVSRYIRDILVLEPDDQAEKHAT